MARRKAKRHDMQRKMSSAPNAVPARDRLTVLPFDLLVKILVNLPLSTFFDLTHTSSTLRLFLRTNAALLCNTVIHARFAFENKQLNAIHFPDQAGQRWLTSHHPELVAISLYYKMIIQDLLLSNKRTGIIDWCVWNIAKGFVDYSEPLRSLQRTAKVRIFTPEGEIKLSKATPYDLREFSLSGPRYLLALEVTRNEQYRPRGYQPFTLWFEESIIEVLDKFGVGGCYTINDRLFGSKRFPREVIWYLGFNNLHRCLEAAGVDCSLRPNAEESALVRRLTRGLGWEVASTATELDNDLERKVLEGKTISGERES